MTPSSPLIGGSKELGRTSPLRLSRSRRKSNRAYSDDITIDEGGEVKTYEEGAQFPPSIPEGGSDKPLSPWSQTRTMSFAMDPLDLDDDDKDQHRLSTFPSSSPSADITESATRAGEVAWDLPTDGGGGDDGAAGAGDSVGGDGEEDLASYTSTGGASVLHNKKPVLRTLGRQSAGKPKKLFSPQTADGRKNLDRPQPQGIGEEVQTEGGDPTWNDEWHTHTDELSGHTYYEHRQSGKAVWASDWDAAGADADTDVATADKVAAAATEDLNEGGDDSGQWDAHLDETSGKRYFAHRTSGAVAWNLPVQRNSDGPDSDGPDAAAGDALSE